MKVISQFLIHSFFYSLIFFSHSFAQENPEDKIKEIDGAVEKITITSGGKEYIFEGADAEVLFEKMKKKHSHSFAWNSTNDDKMNKKIVIINSDGESEEIEISTECHDDFESTNDGINKKIKVEMDNGNKKVTVTTKENGEEKTELYEGKEADEYLEKMKSENDDLDIRIDENSDGKKVKKIIIETEKKETED